MTEVELEYVVGYPGMMRDRMFSALDELGVGVGDRFVIRKVVDVDENVVGASTANAQSRAAALANFPRSGTQRRLVFNAVAEVSDGPGVGGHWRTRGATRDELTARLGLPPNVLTPRVKELLDGGWIAESSRTRKTRSGADAAVLTLTEKGRANV